MITFRPATPADRPLLAELNHHLIRDEGHRNRMTVPELEERMRGWLSGDYQAVIYEENNEVVAYALFREGPEEIYLRQLFVIPQRRNKGIGRKAVEVLRSNFWPKTKRLTVEVLVSNKRGAAFWRAVGYRDYCLELEIPPEISMADPSQELEQQIRSSFAGIKPDLVFQSCKVAAQTGGIIVRIYMQGKKEINLMPTPYQIFRFDPSTGILSELSREEAAPYEIKNYK